jgi:hypothetical protein
MLSILRIKKTCGQGTSCPKFYGTSHFPAIFDENEMQKWLTKITFYLGEIMLLTSLPSSDHIKEMPIIRVLFSAFNHNYRTKEWPVSLHTQYITALIKIHQNVLQN